MITGDSPNQMTGAGGRDGLSFVSLLVLRGLFALVLMSVGMFLVSSPNTSSTSWLSQHKDLVFIAFLGVALVVIALDIWIPRKSLGALSGTFFGLIVGMAMAYGLSLIVNMLAQVMLADADGVTVEATKLAIGVVCCYMCVSFILQTKDDFRFVIPYVQFARQTKGGRPMVLDTSVIIDGRIADIAETRVIESEMIIPRFVLQELQMIADSGDKLKRARGRRGLDMLNRLQTSKTADIRMLDVVSQRKEGAGVDEMLVDLAVELGGKVVTNDYNLNKIAQLRGVTVININDLANALKPVVLPGESIAIKVIKPGEELGQGVGYLEDGTMVVAEGGRDRIGEVVNLTVTSVLQTSAGRMIFGRADGVPPPDRRRFRPPHERPGPGA